MNNSTLVLLLFLGLCPSCEREYPSPASLEYAFGIETKSRPSSIVSDPDNGDLFILCMQNWVSNPVSEVQRFNRDGEFLNTVVDFTNFSGGKYPSYIPRDITVDENRNLYVLVHPRSDTDPNAPGKHPEGFNILSFRPNGSLLDELDFSTNDEVIRPGCIAYSSDHLYTTDGVHLQKISLENKNFTNTLLPTSLSDSLLYPVPITDMEVGQDGKVYLTSQHSQCCPHLVGCQILIYDTKSDDVSIILGNSLTDWFGSWVNQPGISMHSNGDLYIATFYNRSIEVRDRNMELILEKEMDQIGDDYPLPIDIATFRQHVYVVDNRNNRVDVYLAEK